MAVRPRIEPAAQSYLDDLSAAQRPLFDRLHRLVLEVRPDVEIVLSYKMPAYRAGGQSLHVGAWKHGLSLYGWREGEDGGLLERFPELSSGKGTLRLTPAAAEEISDDELRTVIRGALGGAG